MANNKLREALAEISNLADALDVNNPNVVAILDKCRDTLAEPVRNCDVGTASDQNRRYRNYCNSHFRPNNHGGSCERCPLYARKNTICQFAWAQMSYEEGGENGTL